MGATPTTSLVGTGKYRLECRNPYRLIKCSRFREVESSQKKVRGIAQRRSTMHEAKDVATTRPVISSVKPPMEMCGEFGATYDFQMKSFRERFEADGRLI